MSDEAAGATFPFAAPALANTSRFEVAALKLGLLRIRRPELSSTISDGEVICVAAPLMVRVAATDPVSMLALSKMAIALWTGSPRKRRLFAESRRNPLGSNPVVKVRRALYCLLWWKPDQTPARSLFRTPHLRQRKAGHSCYQARKGLF